MGTSSTFQTVTDDSDVTFQKCEKPPSNGHCYRVTDQNGHRGGLARVPATKAVNAHNAAYGEASAWLHRGACEEAWRAARDADDLTIPRRARDAASGDGSVVGSIDHVIDEVNTRRA
jgi:hypothetical protein